LNDIASISIEQKILVAIIAMKSPEKKGRDEYVKEGVH
jgi:hypothetical protein